MNGYARFAREVSRGLTKLPDVTCQNASRIRSRHPLGPISPAIKRLLPLHSFSPSFIPSFHHSIILSFLHSPIPLFPHSFHHSPIPFRKLIPRPVYGHNELRLRRVGLDFIAELRDVHIHRAR